MYVNVDVKLVQERVRNDLFHPQNEISYIIIKIIKIYIKTPAIFLSFYVYLVQVKKDPWFENMGQLYIGQLLVSCFWLVVIGRLLFFGCFWSAVFFAVIGQLLLFGCYWSAGIVWLLLFGCQCLAVIGQLLLFGCYWSAVIFWLIQSAFICQLLLVCCYWSDVVGCYWSVVYWSAVIGRMFLGGCYWLDVNGKLSLVGGFGQLLLIGSTPVCSCSNLSSNPGILPTIVHTVKTPGTDNGTLGT